MRKPPGYQRIRHDRASWHLACSGIFGKAPRNVGAYRRIQQGGLTMRKKIFRQMAVSGLLAAALFVSVAPVLAAGLTPEEQKQLVFIREEEKLARDVYIAMYETWGSLVFSDIKASEQNHMDAVLRLLVKYGIPDPASAQIGVFNDANLQELYQKLVAQGQTSLLGAMMAGAWIEEADIRDLRAAIDGTTKTDLRRVYGNLEEGSGNHLRAFVSHIEALTGQRYVAQILPQDEVDEILGR